MADVQRSNKCKKDKSLGLKVLSLKACEKYANAKVPSQMFCILIVLSAPQCGFQVVIPSPPLKVLL